MSEAKLAEGALGEDVAGDAEGAAGFGGDCGLIDKAAEGEQAGGLGEADVGSELAGGGAEDTAAKAAVEWSQAFDLDRDGCVGHSVADSASTAADGLAGKEERRQDAGELGLPAGLVFAGEFGQVGERSVEVGVELAELGEELVADAVTGEGGVGVGSVFAPGLVEGV